MDYEFRRDLYGRYQAELSMGHEVFALWLTEELGKNFVLIDTVLEQIGVLLGQSAQVYRHAGREFILTMDQDGVEVRAALLDDLADEAPDDLNHYDQESQACCGLDDFYRLLIAWRAFINDSP